MDLKVSAYTLASILYTVYGLAITPSSTANPIIIDPYYGSNHLLYL